MKAESPKQLGKADKVELQRRRSRSGKIKSRNNPAQIMDATVQGRSSLEKMELCDGNRTTLWHEGVRVNTLRCTRAVFGNGSGDLIQAMVSR